MSSDPRCLIFDGDCAFCSSSVRFGRRWIGRMPPAVPYQHEDVIRFGLTEADCAAAVQYVGRDGRVHAGHDAISALLIDAGRGWWLVGTAMRVPGIHWLGSVVYRWVARNRHRLPGGTAACAVSAPSEPNEPR